MTLKEIKIRLTMPLNNFWKKIQKLCIKMAVLVPTAGKLSEYTGFIPDGFIPDWVKGLVGGMIVMGILLPQLTVHDAKELEEKLKNKIDPK